MAKIIIGLYVYPWLSHNFLIFLILYYGMVQGSFQPFTTLNTEPIDASGVKTSCKYLALGGVLRSLNTSKKKLSLTNRIIVIITSSVYPTSIGLPVFAFA